MREEVGMLYEDDGWSPYFHNKTCIQVTFRHVDYLISPTRLQYPRSGPAPYTLRFRSHAAVRSPMRPPLFAVP